ncbi:TPA: autotransporter outer membrane beta-barrel domain-containing protein, partial [Citrobacter sedlakii]|nr:autotransporter outer membrane beta-barrel domain-containing protein [Citrobacter sedlakii]HBL4722422.1 autotransporter outer membrane beta-barrel domain-containing protein [Citrobacter sedlakii]HCA7843343.1 autotransporter outer membrane beta-barrel domain-containing protein [Citrobacter sedlakii]HCA7848287.1 autotransporter outer membrane beta-barrel domain-containing protein [Citrobacter sedlakii]
VQTRVGVRLFGKGHSQLDDGKARTFQPFIEANWLHNSKEFGVSMNGDNINLAGTRDVGELKAGVEGQLSKYVSLWGTLGQQVGDKGYSDTTAVLGIRVTF